MTTSTYANTSFNRLRYGYSVLVLVILTIPSIVNSQSNVAKSTFTVVIDAGHGGKDPGCLGNISKEKDIALKVALKTGKLITQKHPNVKVLYTRDDDTFIPLHERAGIANRNNADLFISVHANFAPNKPNVVGTETFVMGLHKAEKNLDVVRRENSVIEMEDNKAIYDDLDINSPIGHIVLQNRQSQNLEASIQFADLVQDEFTYTNKRNNRGVKQAGFLVLYQTTMPSVLIEVGFLSNKTEEKYLNSAKGNMVMSQGIARAFEHYLNNLYGHKEKLVERKVIPKEIKDSPDVPVKRDKETAKQDNPKKSKSKWVDVPTNDSDEINLVYKIQLVALKNKPSLDYVSKLSAQSSQVETEYKDGIYRILAGKFRSLELALKEKERLIGLGYTGAFIVPRSITQEINKAENISSEERS